MNETCLFELPRKVEELELAIKRYSSALDEACRRLATLDRRLTAQQWREDFWYNARVKR